MDNMRGEGHPGSFLIHDNRPKLAATPTFMDGTFLLHHASFYSYLSPIKTTAISCVCVCLTGKETAEPTGELFLGAVDKCQEYNLYPDLTTVLTDSDTATLPLSWVNMFWHLQTNLGTSSVPFQSTEHTFVDTD